MMGGSAFLPSDHRKKKSQMVWSKKLKKCGLLQYLINESLGPLSKNKKITFGAFCDFDSSPIASQKRTLYGMVSVIL